MGCILKIHLPNFLQIFLKFEIGAQFNFIGYEKQNFKPATDGDAWKVFHSRDSIFGTW